MLHGDDDFGQVLVFDTSTNKTAKIHTPLVPFSFLFLKLKKKKKWVCPSHSHDMPVHPKKKRKGVLTKTSLFLLILWSDSSYLPRKSFKKKEQSFWPTLLFLSNLWSNQCGMPSQSRLATFEPAPASSDPKTHNFSFFRFWVLSFGHSTLSFLFFFLFLFGLT